MSRQNNTTQTFTREVACWITATAGFSVAIFHTWQSSSLSPFLALSLSNTHAHTHARTQKHTGRHRTAPYENKTVRRNTSASCPFLWDACSSSQHAYTAAHIGIVWPMAWSAACYFHTFTAQSCVAKTKQGQSRDGGGGLSYSCINGGIQMIQGGCLYYQVP